MNAAHRPSSLSYCHALNLTTLVLRRSFSRGSFSASSNCSMNDDLPEPHRPSIESVKGVLVDESVRNPATARTYGAKPSLSSFSVPAGWSPSTWSAMVSAAALLASMLSASESPELLDELLPLLPDELLLLLDWPRSAIVCWGA